MAQFKFTNTVSDKAVAAEQVVTISPTLVYNKDTSAQAAAKDAVTVLFDGAVRVPVYGRYQNIVIPKGENRTIDVTDYKEIAFFENLVALLSDSDVVKAEKL